MTDKCEELMTKLVNSVLQANSALGWVSNEKFLELFNDAYNIADEIDEFPLTKLLELRHPTPIPVSERLPEPKDCDEEGQCWWFDDDDCKWCLNSPEMGIRLLCWTHWLPYYSFPIPSTK